MRVDISVNPLMSANSAVISVSVTWRKRRAASPSWPGAELLHRRRREEPHQCIANHGLGLEAAAQACVLEGLRRQVREGREEVEVAFGVAVGGHFAVHVQHALQLVVEEQGRRHGRTDGGRPHGLRAGEPEVDERVAEQTRGTLRPHPLDDAPAVGRLFELRRDVVAHGDGRERMGACVEEQHGAAIRLEQLKREFQNALGDDFGGSRRGEELTDTQQEAQFLLGGARGDRRRQPEALERRQTVGTARWHRTGNRPRGIDPPVEVDAGQRGRRATDGRRFDAPRLGCVRADRRLREDETKRHLAEPEPITGLQRLDALDAFLVDVGAVLAAEVRNRDARPGDLEPGVQARQARRSHAQGALLGATERADAVGEGQASLLGTTGEEDQFVHGGTVTQSRRRDAVNPRAGRRVRVRGTPEGARDARGVPRCAEKR
jgi:hypothetical protein